MSTTIELPNGLLTDVVAVRRDLHAHPELGFHEHRTAGIVAARLRELGFEVHTAIATTGVVGVLHGAKPGRTVLLRADMDGLPMHEANDVPYRSRTENVMHACGHDGHVATLLGAAEIVAKRRQGVAGTIVVCFQPAEEGGGGARVMVESGVIERFGVERAYGLHYLAHLPTGNVGIRGGPLMASADRIEIEVVGKGGHGAMPQLSVDPIVTAATFVANLQQLVSRRVDPIQPAVVSICSFHAGSTNNVIPTSAQLMGTVRTFDEALRARMPDEIERSLRGTCDAAGATYRYDYHPGFPVTINDLQQAAYVRQVAQQTFGAQTVSETPPLMGAEDFSYFAQRVPAAFIFVGSGGDERTRFPNHHDHFDLDERAFETGVRLLAALALDAPTAAP